MKIVGLQEVSWAADGCYNVLHSLHNLKQLCTIHRKQLSLIREVVKKTRIFYGQADRKGWPPPPYGQLFCDFFGGVHLTLVYD